jgi:serine/threonine-protein kinase
MSEGDEFELDPPGTALGKYVVERVLGRGGMAVVYRVRHTQLGSVHSLKRLTVHPF